MTERTFEADDAVPLRRTWAEVDLTVLRRNVELLVEVVAPAEVCAVVKADGYGHGAVATANAVLAGGATRLAVALVAEGIELREAGITVPILVLSEADVDAMDQVASNDLTPTLYSLVGVRAASAAAVKSGRALSVHIKVDTGMHRVGVVVDDAPAIARAVVDSPGLLLEGLYTHFAVADEADNDFTELQAQRFEVTLDRLERDGIVPPLLHGCNSAGGLRFPGLRMSMVRFGIALYGQLPSRDVSLPSGVKQAMTVRGSVTHVVRHPAGEAISYGQHYRLQQSATVATVAIGYADGVFRRLSAEGGEVLIRGRRYPIAGSVTMDQLMVDVGDDPVNMGDEVVLLGRQGDEEITGADIGDKVQTISYEVVCRFGASRLPRRYVRP